MLIITRKLGEGIVLGDNISLVINEIADGKVKIAIEAPKDVKILRKELADAADANIESTRMDIPRDALAQIAKLKK